METPLHEMVVAPDLNWSLPIDLCDQYSQFDLLLILLIYLTEHYMGKPSVRTKTMNVTNSHPILVSESLQKEESPGS